MRFRCRSQLIAYRVSNPQTPVSPASRRKHSCTNPPLTGSPEVGPGRCGGGGESVGGGAGKGNLLPGEDLPKSGVGSPGGGRVFMF